MEFAPSIKTTPMIRAFFLLFCLFCATNTMAIQKDTSAYQTQRLRINALLAERSAKFGQYELSLSARTGIFGLQTKNDLKNSNEILRGIILSDNNIFRELKVLMNYKDQEVEQVQSTAENTNKRVEGYVLAIKKLQEQNEELKKDSGQTIEKKDTATYIIIFLILIIIGGTLYFVNRLRTTTTPKI